MNAFLVHVCYEFCGHCFTGKCFKVYARTNLSPLLVTVDPPFNVVYNGVRTCIG